MKSIKILLCSILFFYSCTTPPNILKDRRDGQVYSTITIGDQIWMAENLAYLPEVSPPISTSDTDPFYYIYDYDGTDEKIAKSTTNYQTYGVLYNWPAAMKACPAGWHLPNDTDWTQLIEYLGGETFAGGKMKETGTTHWESSNEEVTNISGFTVLPGGYRDYGSDDFKAIGKNGYFWASTWNSKSNAWHRLFPSYSNIVYHYANSKSNGFSVRCIKGVTYPTILTSGVSEITSTTAKFTYDIISDGGSALSTLGITLYEIPKANDTGNLGSMRVSGAMNPKLGTYTKTYEDLTPNTTYRVNVAVGNIVGEAHGEERMFTTRHY